MNAFDVIALVSALAFLWVYVGYPALVWLLARTSPRPHHREPFTPHVSVLVPAHDEGAGIRAKVLDILGADYPLDRVEVFVLSDGSTDDTVAEARAAAGALSTCAGAPTIHVLDLPRLGKARTLEAGVRAASHEMLVFTDANVGWRRDSLRRLMENFADPAVGGACGEKRHRDPVGPTGRGEGLYWRYENGLKRLESRIGSTVAADGALYAIRAHLFTPVTNPASADDMAISMPVVLKGFRLVCDPRAVVVEDAPSEPGAELRRKIRITNHSMRALLDLGPALLTSGFYSVQLVSHKLLRHLSPLLLLASLLSSCGSVLTGGGLAGQVLLLAYLTLFVSAGMGQLLRMRAGGPGRLLAAAHHFTLMQAAALVGLFSLLRGDRLVAWRPRGGLEAA